MDRDQKKYLLTRLAGACAVAYKRPNDTKEVAAARRVILKFDKACDGERARKYAIYKLGKKNAEEAIHRGDFNDALKAVKAFESRWQA